MHPSPPGVGGPDGNFTVEKFKWILTNALEYAKIQPAMVAQMPWLNRGGLGVNQLTLKIQDPTNQNLKTYIPGQGNDVIISPGSYVEIEHRFPNQ